MVAFGIMEGANGGIELESFDVLDVLVGLLDVGEAPLDEEVGLLELGITPVAGVVEFAVAGPANGSNFAMPSFIRS